MSQVNGNGVNDRNDNNTNHPGLHVFGAHRNRLIGRAKAAAGKALLVYLGTGSLGVAIVAYLIFRMMGC